MRGNLSGDADRRVARPGLLAGAGAALALIVATGAAAQTVAQTISDPDRTYVYSSAGVVLPTPAPTYGQDEVQGAGGVACRSSVGGGGAFLDAGVVGSQDPYQRSTTSAYARIVVPLGSRPERIDCTALYRLELERLRMELQVARMSLPGPQSVSTVVSRQPSTMPFDRSAPPPVADRAATNPSSN